MKESEIQEPAFAFQQVPEALSAYCLSKAYIHAPVFPRVFPLVFITEILHCRGNESHHKHRQRNEYKYAARLDDGNYAHHDQHHKRRQDDEPQPSVGLIALLRGKTERNAVIRQIVYHPRRSSVLRIFFCISVLGLTVSVNAVSNWA